MDVVERCWHIVNGNMPCIDAVYRDVVVGLIADALDLIQSRRRFRNICLVSLDKLRNFIHARWR